MHFSRGPTAVGRVSATLKLGLTAIHCGRAAADGPHAILTCVPRVPAVDIKEYQDRFELLADIPGIDPKDVEITLDDSVLTLSGERRGRRLGRFHRRFILPDAADGEKVTATGHNGVLAITIAKHAKAQGRNNRQFFKPDMKVSGRSEAEGYRAQTVLWRRCSPALLVVALSCDASATGDVKLFRCAAVRGKERKETVHMNASPITSLATLRAAATRSQAQFP